MFGLNSVWYHFTMSIRYKQIMQIKKQLELHTGINDKTMHSIAIEQIHCTKSIWLVCNTSCVQLELENWISTVSKWLMLSFFGVYTQKKSC